MHAADTAPANQHLADAIASHQKVLEQNAADLFSLLGLAWSYAEAGRTEMAITTSRKAHDMAWKQESEKEDLQLGGSVTGESGEARLALLPADQPAELQERIAAISCKPMWVTPVIFPTGGDASLGEIVAASGRSAAVCPTRAAAFIGQRWCSGR